jgi:hypothetical protein
MPPKAVPARPRPTLDGDNAVAVDVLVDILKQIRNDNRLGRSGRDENEREREQEFLRVTRGTYPQDDYLIDDDLFSPDDRTLISAADAAKVVVRRRRRLERQASLERRGEIATTPPSSTTVVTGTSKRRFADPGGRVPKRPRPSKVPSVAGAADDDGGGSEGLPGGSGDLQEITLTSIIEQLRREDSLLRHLFLQTLAFNYEAWLNKIAELQASIKQRRPNIVEQLERRRSRSTSSTGSSRSGSTGSEDDDGGGGRGTARHADADDIQQQEEHDDEILWERSTRIGSTLRTELTILSYVQNRPVRGSIGEEARATVNGYVQRMLTGMARLDALVGLLSLKDNVAVLLLTNWLTSRDNTARKLFGDHRNILLYGDPGTGKTQSATLLREVLRGAGIIVDLPPGVLHNYGRSELVAAYAGQTAIKFRRAFAENWGTMMFIDEFYTLNSGTGADEFGEEGIGALVKLTEDYKGQVLVVGAGYKKLIQTRILAVNEGLNSRFPYKWVLPNYSAAQLFRILVDSFRAERVRLDTETTRPTDGNETPPITTTPTFTPPPAPPSPPKPLRALDTENVEEILRDLTKRADASGFFQKKNARGARALTIAIDTQRQRRLFSAVLPLNNDERYNANAPVVAVDVYRGFASWVFQSQDAHVVYLDERVDALVGDTD